MTTLNSPRLSTTIDQADDHHFNLTDTYPTSAAKNPHELTLIKRSRGVDGSNDGKANDENTMGNSGGISTQENEGKNAGESQYPGGVAFVIIIIGLMLAGFVVALDNTIIATAIPTITSRFNSLDDVGWYGSSYLLTTTAVQPTFGKIYVYYSVKWTFMIAVVIFELGSAVCATAPSSAALIIGRAIAGIGASGIYSGGITILQYTVPLRKRSIYIALLTSMFGVSAIVGPLIGGALTDNLSWRWCFWINLPIGGITLATIFLFLKDPSREHNNLAFKEKLNEMDLLGACFFIGSVVCLLLALRFGGSRYSWSESRVWGCLIGFGIFFIVFIHLQFRLGDRATIAIRIISQRSVACSCIFMGLISMGLYAHMYYLPFYFQASRGVSAQASGIRTIPYLLSNPLASLLIGAAVAKFGWYTPFMYLGSALFTVGSGLLYTLQVDSTAAKWISYQILAAFGVGASIQIPYAAVQVVLAQKDLPVGTALVIFFNSLGGALATSIAEAIFSNTLRHELTRQVPQIDPNLIINAGATRLREVVTPPALLPAVLRVYDTAVTRAFLLSIAAGGLAFLSSLGMEWRSVKGQKVEVAAGG